MKYLCTILISFFILNNSFGQTESKNWKQHIQKIYIEADAGTLPSISIGASANIGYQFNPYLGLGLTGSGFSGTTDADALFPPSWSGWGAHWRVVLKPFIFRLDFGKINNGRKGDDTLYCDAWKWDKEKTNFYRSFSIEYKWGFFKFGWSVSYANLDYHQICTDPPVVNFLHVDGITFVPKVGLSFGGKLKN